MDIKEIESAMHTLACGDTNYEAVARLASLIVVRDHLISEHMPQLTAYSGTSRAIVPATGGSEFLSAVADAPLEEVMKILDKHMEALSVIVPAEYELVMRQLRKL